MTEDAINGVLGILERHMHEDEDEIKRHIDLLELGGNEPEGPKVINGVGVLNLEGPIFPKANLMTELSGATSLDTFRDQFRAFVSDPSVSSILVNIDSPGGVADLVMETGREIREAREFKPVITIANTMAASAALWLASQGSEFYITDSGLTGSLGVFQVHMDYSEQEKSKGITKTILKAGNAKAASQEPLNEHTRANLQAMVDDCYLDFVNEVALGRDLDFDNVRENFGDGGIVSPREAVRVGMVDGIKTYESLLGEMSENGGVVGNASAVAAMSALTRKGMITGEVVQLTTNSANTRMTFEPDLEHAEPGTQGEPIPKESPMEGDPAVTGGWRVPSNAQPSFPPAAHQPPPTQKGARKGSAMEREQLVALANLVGLSFDDDTSDEDLFAAITSNINEVVVPLNEAAAEAEKHRSFAKDYPAEYDKFRELLERDEENEARTFASRWERFSIKDGETITKSAHGFSGRVLSNIEDLHLKLSRKQLQENDIAELLDSIAETGSVDYTERGSAVHHERANANVDQMGIKEARDLFAAEVRSIMEDDGVDRRTAIKLLGQRNPDLAAAYKSGHVRR
jgi:capsid assembly protease